MYSERQISVAVRRGLVDFADFIDKIQREVEDERFFLFIDRLLMNIYIMHSRGRYMSKTQACRLIPAEHIDTCSKYVKEAERLGFFSYHEDETDKRRKLIHPTPEFINFVKKHATKSLDEMRDLLIRAS